VYNEIYFQVTLDDLSADATTRSVVCHANSPGLLPVQWCLKNGVALERPRGYEGQDFDWADYLKQTGSEAAPDACFPDVRMGYLLLHSLLRGKNLLTSLRSVLKPLSECIVDVESMDIFPVGWCEANAYPLTPPIKPVGSIAAGRASSCEPLPARRHGSSLANCYSPLALEVQVLQQEGGGSANGRYCCSRIFVNHRCFSGPYLNKGRITELPQAVGPGKCTLVLKEVSCCQTNGGKLLSMLINAAYKPGRVLKELQELEDQSWECQEETLKAKYKGKTYRSIIRIVRLAEQIPDFCRKVCVKLQCCPNLFGTALVTDKCPENCSVQTKTKYSECRRKDARQTLTTLLQALHRSDSDEAEDDEDLALQSGSEGTSSEPRDDHTDASSVEVTSSSGSRRPRRAVTLRRAFSDGTFTAVQETPGACRRSTRSLSAHHQNNKYQPHKGQDVKVEEDDGQLVLDRNPLEWSVDEVVQFINSTDCASLANIFREQDIDGQALLLLTLPTVQECMDLKLGPAIKLCHQIERVKVAFYKQFAN
ncbi:hypothetical protein XENOCAPTIV_029542, partial [Xenoophorus captivus]